MVIRRNCVNHGSFPNVMTGDLPVAGDTHPIPTCFQGDPRTDAKKVGKSDSQVAFQQSAEA